MPNVEHWGGRIAELDRQTSQLADEADNLREQAELLTQYLAESDDPVAESDLELVHDLAAQNERRRNVVAARLQAARVERLRAQAAAQADADVAAVGQAREIAVELVRASEAADAAFAIAAKALAHRAQVARKLSPLVGACARLGCEIPLNRVLHPDRPHRAAWASGLAPLVGCSHLQHSARQPLATGDRGLLASLLTSSADDPDAQVSELLDAIGAREHAELEAILERVNTHEI